MKKIKYLGNKRPYIAKAKVQKEEHIQLGTLAKENNLDMHKLAKKINISFLLADVIESLVIDVENEIKSVDSTLVLQLRHPTSRIKIHAREMVKFVSETYDNGDGAIEFGDKADEFREKILSLFENF